MFDFILTAIITIFTNIFIIAPYWDQLKDMLLQQGHDKIDVMKTYYLLCGGSYIAIGFVVFFVIKFIKLIYNKYF